MFQNYDEYEYPLACCQLVLFMLGMGATLAPRDFVQVALRPRSLLVGAAFLIFGTPLVAIAINRGLALEAGIAVGLILVSIMPGGQMSKLFTYLARGNVALSITLSAGSTLAALITVPLLLELLAEDYLRNSNFQMPAGLVVRDVAVFLLLPLLVGMSVARFAPTVRTTFSRWCIRVGLVFVVLMVVGSLASGRIHPATYGWKVPLAIILYCVLTQQLSMLPFRLLGWPQNDCVAVGIEVTMRNMNLALLLKALLFPEAGPVGDGVLFVVLYYAGTALIVGFPLAFRYRLKARARADAPRPV